MLGVVGAALDHPVFGSIGLISDPTMSAGELASLS
jgi:hypothetical protein